jgi:ribosomal protein S18 acetylase RimI-like enzyme
MSIRKQQAMVIKKAGRTDIPLLLDILHKSFADVAKKFNLTVENCPTSPAFCTKQRIEDDFAKGLEYYILNETGKSCGCVALEKAGSGTCYLERLAVLPEHRRKGFGAALVRHIFDKAAEMKMQQIEIGIISENIELKNWYGKFGFTRRGTKKFAHLPFTVEFMSIELEKTL